MRITNGDRDLIVSQLVSDTMKAREAAHKKAERALADEVIRWALGKHYKAYMALPEEFQHIDDHFCVASAGKRIVLHHDKKQPTCGKTINVTGEVKDRVEDFMAENERIKRDRDTLRAQARGILFSAQTEKQLRELWPAGAKYYEPIISGNGKLPISVQALEKTIAECKA